MNIYYLILISGFIFLFVFLVSSVLRPVINRDTSILFILNYIKYRFRVLHNCFKAKKAETSKNCLSVDSPTHIMFLFVDDFEPEDSRMDIVKQWIEDYPSISKKHLDSDGLHPKHTWFYWGTNVNILTQLAGLCYEDLGEIEVHLHHQDDTAEILTKKLDHIKEVYANTGALITLQEHPRIRYGFRHGMFALDNSRKGKHCGVNNELQVLKQTGCYADFTFPGWGPMQPAKINSIYYAIDDPDRPKSYNTGWDVQAGKSIQGDLMIFQGPGLGRSNYLGGSYLFGLPTREKIDTWIYSQVHVIGRPKWIFVKVTTHGARKDDLKLVLSEKMNSMYSYLGSKYNGSNYKLHYVTAREAYNIVRAAQDDKSGNPNQYRDYIIPPYANTRIKSDASYRLKYYKKHSFALDLLNAGKTVSLELKDYFIERLKGQIQSVEYQEILEIDKIIIRLSGNKTVTVEIHLPETVKGISLTNAAILKTKVEGGMNKYIIAADLAVNQLKEITIRKI